MKLKGRTQSSAAPVQYDHGQWKPVEQVSQPPRSRVQTLLSLIFPNELTEW